MSLFPIQTRIESGVYKRENRRVRGEGVVQHRYTATFKILGRGTCQLYFMADSMTHAIESFERFLGELTWFEIPRPPGVTRLRCRTSDVRDHEIIDGWPTSVETWPAVQDLNRDY